MPQRILIKSTSGVRGIVGAGLDPLLATAYGAAFGTMLRKSSVVVGRDSRPSGEMLTQAVVAGLTSVGIPDRGDRRQETESGRRHLCHGLA